MKPVGMQYLAAIRALKRKGIERLKRTIHLTYVPDEETGGEFGMQAFVKSDEFKSLNVGCALDEGYPSKSNDLEVFYTEKTGWSVLKIFNFRLRFYTFLTCGNCFEIFVLKKVGANYCPRPFRTCINSFQ